MPFLRRLLAQPYALALVLLVLGLIVTALFQPAFFTGRTLANNLRTFLPLILLAVAQTLVVIGGGIDLSLGAILTLSSVVMVQTFGQDPDPGPWRTFGGIALGLLVATLAGAAGGFCVAYLRLQPIIATFATSFVWAGLALWVLPQPGGNVPLALQNFVRLQFLLPFSLWVVLAILLGWSWFLATPWAKHLYAVGGNPQAAFTSGVNVEGVRLGSYALAGFLTGLGAFFLTADIATGDPLIGGPLTLASVVAVVIGGTRLSGGTGGIVGSVLGAVVYYLLKNVVALGVFNLGLSPQWQTLIDGTVIVLALATPGLLRRARGRA
ncbi:MULTISPECIES: ABC transporter permease [unclassified Meiothermus]|uniref:ABC transporter permease n=1 Tax=unclassified Meiothermus TaxID=370471 RepID=UPI000D7D0150|nr:MULTISPECIES: ABC transporter permease [unclassified Meiothermus]PZA06307.1 ABC transporter permease [Meiothermus sp. Pnk-1]RYM36367.1 ABC transporter permease [Meiothermus sp. PNK-Is4]